MTTATIVGSVEGLWRFPVKSMQGERLEQSELTEGGLMGDRAYALVDRGTGKIVSAKSVRLFPDLLQCKAAFVEEPRSGSDLPPARITLPNGTSVTSDSHDADRVLSAFFRREVTLTGSGPDDFTIDMYYPDLENLDPAGTRDCFIEQKLGAAYYAEVGQPSAVPVGSFFDLFPISVLTTSTLERLSEIRPESQFDQRRFRMNIIVTTEEPGYVENGWMGHEIAIGDNVSLRMELPDPRCVMTTLAQGELPADRDVLRTLARYNRVDIANDGLFPCAGAYALVQSPGRIRKGDCVVLC